MREVVRSIKLLLSLIIIMVSVFILVVVSVISMLFNSVLFMLMITGLSLPVAGNILKGKIEGK